MRLLSRLRHQIAAQPCELSNLSHAEGGRVSIPAERQITIISCLEQVSEETISAARSKLCNSSSGRHHDDEKNAAHHNVRFFESWTYMSPYKMMEDA
jgi:hypothetical protein